MISTTTVRLTMATTDQHSRLWQTLNTRDCRSRLRTRRPRNMRLLRRQLSHFSQPQVTRPSVFSSRAIVRGAARKSSSSYPNRIGEDAGERGDTISNHGQRSLIFVFGNLEVFTRNTHQGKISTTVGQVETSPAKFFLKLTSQLFKVLKSPICEDIVYLKKTCSTDLFTRKIICIL